MYLLCKHAYVTYIQFWLAEHNPEKVLKWSERLAILIGAAKAVHFLHAGIIPGFSNNQLKANNILLDEHHIAKLSDYGLSIITEEIDRLEVRVKGQNNFYSFDIFESHFSTVLVDYLD